MYLGNIRLLEMQCDSYLGIQAPLGDVIYRNMVLHTAKLGGALG